MSTVGSSFCLCKQLRGLWKNWLSGIIAFYWALLAHLSRRLKWGIITALVCCLFANIVFVPLFASKFGLCSLFPELHALFPCSPEHMN